KILDCLNTGQVSVPITNDPVQNEEGIVVENITVAAGIAGMPSSSVENCENRGAVSGYTAGGIVTRFTSSVSLYKLKNCTNSGQITGTRSAAGVVATITKGGIAEALENSGSVTGPYCVGGVVAENVKGSLTDCVNTGTIQGSETEIDDDFFALGGVCGMNDSGNMTNCSNSGTVSRIGQTGKYRYVGGMVGVTARATGTGGLLKGCSNSGPVSGHISEVPEDYNYVGGFCGLFASGPAPEDCTNTGTVNGQPASDENMYGGTN
ncbi:MAG: GLUG motif-containing protein, partial [Bacteroidales bacterium]|nr:GLUG motif-containing protein [Bacteroidales bacterium]